MCYGLGLTKLAQASSKTELDRFQQCTAAFPRKNRTQTVLAIALAEGPQTGRFLNQLVLVFSTSFQIKFGQIQSFLFPLFACDFLVHLRLSNHILAHLNQRLVHQGVKQRQTKGWFLYPVRHFLFPWEKHHHSFIFQGKVSTILARYSHWLLDSISVSFVMFSPI